MFVCVFLCAPVRVVVCAFVRMCLLCVFGVCVCLCKCDDVHLCVCVCLVCVCLFA